MNTWRPAWKVRQRAGRVQIYVVACTRAIRQSAAQRSPHGARRGALLALARQHSGSQLASSSSLSRSFRFCPKALMLQRRGGGWQGRRSRWGTGQASAAAAARKEAGPPGQACACLVAGAACRRRPTGDMRPRSTEQRNPAAGSQTAHRLPNRMDQTGKAAPEAAAPAVPKNMRSQSVRSANLPAMGWQAVWVVDRMHCSQRGHGTAELNQPPLGGRSCSHRQAGCARRVVPIPTKEHAPTSPQRACRG